MPVRTARQDLLHARLERFTRMLPGIESGDVKAVHKTRVASRRLRELLPLLELEPDTARRLTRRLRKATRQLGGVRELDVMLALTEELRASGRHPDRAIRSVATDVRTMRDQARRRFAGKRPVDELRQVARSLEKIERKIGKAEQGGHGRAWEWALEARIAKRAASLKKAADGAGALYLPERLHEVRIALKKLRYAVELATEASGARSGADLKVLKRLQALLGRLHDLQVLVDRVRSVQASLNPPDVVLWRDLDILLIGLDRSCRQLHARFMRERAALIEICERLARTRTEARAASPRRAARRAG